jgi:hypothetical protein
VEACAYRRPGAGRDGVTAALRLGLEIEGLFGSARDQALVLRDRGMEAINSPAEGRARLPLHTVHPRIPHVRGPRQALRPRSCAHEFSAGIAPLAPKNPLLSIRRLPGTRPNMPTDRKLGPGDGHGRSEHARLPRLPARPPLPDSAISPGEASELGPSPPTRQDVHVIWEAKIESAKEKYRACTQRGSRFACRRC